MLEVRWKSDDGFVMVAKELGRGTARSGNET